VRGLVLAVFLGTIAGSLIPTIDALSLTPSSAALSGVLLDTFSLPGPNGSDSSSIQREIEAVLRACRGSSRTG
jgi:hypothetical protein